MPSNHGIAESWQSWAETHRDADGKRHNTDSAAWQSHGIGWHAGFAFFREHIVEFANQWIGEEETENAE